MRWVLRVLEALRAWGASVAIHMLRMLPVAVLGVLATKLLKTFEEIIVWLSTT